MIGTMWIGCYHKSYLFSNQEENMQNLLYEVFFTVAVIQFPKKYILKKKILILFTIQVIGHSSREATVANWLHDGHSQKTRAGHSLA